MLRNTSSLDENLSYSPDKWVISVAHHPADKKTELVIEGMDQDKNLVFKTFSSNGANKKHEYKEEWNAKSFEIKPEKARKLIDKLEGEIQNKSSKINGYTLKYHLNNQAEADYQWARNKLLSVVNFARLPRGLNEFQKPEQPKIKAGL